MIFMAEKLKRRWFQFSLRSALAASFLFALFLGWWFRPFVMETHRPDGSLRRRFTVCRDWRGRLVSQGKQTWVFPDGTRLEKTSHGLPLDKDEFEALLTSVEKFDILIELITETVEPDSWSKNVDFNLVYGSGQVIKSHGGMTK
jgi:hypothetical protein